jgi:thiol-disulfide isomerase/thioredoxin
LKKNQLAKVKNPWEAINIANIYLRLENNIQALNWLDEAVRRGFIDYRLFDQSRYKPLILEKKFLALIEEIKLIIGLGEKARDFTAPMLSGEIFTLSKLKGKVVLIYFWATWCKPCRQEIPYLQSFYSEATQRGFEIIGINLDSSRKILNRYLKRGAMAWKTISSGKAWQGEVVKLYGVNSLPSAWIIDRKGYLRSFGLKGKALVKAINTLISEK